jgi:hypothetical protein
MRIDHVIYATADLESATARLETELDRPAAGGGRHDGLGTHNRVIPLGRGYVVVLAIADAQEAAGSALGRAVAARIEAAGDGLIGWAVAVDDVAAEAQRAGLEVTTIARQGLTARLAGVAEAMAEPCFPFFIERDPGVADPATAGREGPGIEWIEVAGHQGRLAAWLGEAEELPVRIVGGEPALLAVGIGEHTLR